MSHFVDIKSRSFEEKHISPRRGGVFKAGMVHCYKHSTPNGVQRKSSRAKIFLPHQIGGFAHRSNPRQLRFPSSRN